MRKVFAVFLIVICFFAFFHRAGLAASKIAVNETKAIACMFENKDSGKTEEIDRVAFTGVGGLWVVDDNCQKTAREYAKQRALANWRSLCCPVTHDEKVHCESPLGSHGKWP